jgi:predicted MFS family arabinose efflux permease
MKTEKQQEIQPLGPMLFALTFTRLILNGLRRFPFLILTPMAQSLGVPRSTLEAVLSAMWATGVVSPFSGAYLDRIGRKRMMLFGVGLMAIVMFVAAVTQNATVVMLAIVVGGIAKVLYDPAMQAYVGDRTPYEKRGMAIGVTELAWSLGLFVFGPLAAFLIVNATLGTIFAVMAAGSVFSFALILRVIHHDEPTVTGTTKNNFAVYLDLFKNRSALTILVTACVMSIALDLPVISYEAWLRNSFAMTTLIIGSLAWVFGAAEILGETLVISIGDRFGKKRLTVFGIVASGIFYMSLPLANALNNSVVTVVLLFLMFLAFEISVVGLIPLATEAAPATRGAMMSANVAFFSAGHAIGTLIGGAIYRAGGIGLVGVVAMMLAFTCAVIVARNVQHN